MSTSNTETLRYFLNTYFIPGKPVSDTLLDMANVLLDKCLVEEVQVAD